VTRATWEPPTSAAVARELRRMLLVVAAPVTAVGLALVIGAVMIVAIGENPFSIYGLMARETLGTGYGLARRCSAPRR
jgi:ABC-type uncharacterized transport system permease subunit